MLMLIQFFTRGDVGLGLQPPRHKDKVPNRSTTACWPSKVVVRGTTRVTPALHDFFEGGLGGSAPKTHWGMRL